MSSPARSIRSFTCSVASSVRAQRSDRGRSGTDDDGRMPGASSARIPAAPRAVRPPPRARCVWRGVRRDPDRRCQSRHRGAGAHRAAQPRPPRSRGGRGQLRRRRRHPDAGPRRVPARGGPRRGVRAAPEVGVRRGHRVPARRRRAGHQDPPPHRGDRVRRGPRGPRVARGADQPHDPGPDGARRDADVQPAVRGRGRVPPDRHGARAARLRACASAPSTRPTCTSRRCRRARSPTRAC